jgi:DMSO/TMAO reductase YedYZ molybdopterin-dependent catalytic subunit
LGFSLAEAGSGIAGLKAVLDCLRDERSALFLPGGSKPKLNQLITLKSFPAYEVVAVNQCSGNRRGLSKPHVPGVQWGYGAMGCARWKGARLKDVLDKVGLKKEAIEIAFNGAEGPAFEKTPDFIKSLPVWKARLTELRKEARRRAVSTGEYKKRQNEIDEVESALN